MPGWKRVRIRTSIDRAPISFRPFTAHEEFNDKDNRGQSANTAEFNNLPLLPGRIAEEPGDDQRCDPKPRIPGMCEEHGDIPQKTRLFGHAHLVAEPGVEFKERTKTHLRLGFAVFLFGADFLIVAAALRC